jgi:hypothetical protein
MRIDTIAASVFVLFFACVSAVSAEPMELQTPDGQTVILYPDRTWEYKRPPPTPEGDTVELDALVEARLLGAYRLNSTNGQNNIVVDVTRTRRADQIELDAALEKAGFMGTVRLQIQGRMEQGTVTYRLVAANIVLIN